RRTILLVQLTEYAGQQVARDGVGRAKDVVVGGEFLVRALEAGVDDRHPYAGAAGRGPGVTHVHPVVVPLQDVLGVLLTEERCGVVPGVGNRAGTRIADSR